VAHLTAADIAAVVEFLGAQSEAANEEAFLSGLLPGLRELIRCDAIGFNDIDAEAQTVSWLADPVEVGEACDELREGFELNMHQHPVLETYERTGDGRARRTSDLINAREFHRREVYNDFYRPLELEHHLIARLKVSDSRHFAIALFRSSHDFSDRDLTVLALLRPYLALAHRHAEAHARASVALAALNDAGHALVLLGRGGQPHTCVGAAEELLCSHFGTATPLSDDLCDWIATQRRRIATDEPPPLPLPFRIASASGELHCRYVADADGAGHDGLLLTERTSFVLRDRQLAQLGLTSREIEVLMLAVRGRTNSEIAGDLFISYRTVKKHFEHVYAKLGVSTRSAAIATALGMRQSSA